MSTRPPPPPLRAGFVRPVRLGGEGPTRQQARGRRWRRTSHGFYVPSSVSEDDVDQRIVEASVVVPPRYGIGGWAALRWRGGRWFGGLDTRGEPLPVDIVVSTHDIRPQPGLAISAEAISPTEVEWVDGVPVVIAPYAVSFLMRHARSLREAVVALEMAAYSDLVSIEEMEQYLTPGQNGWTGVPLARRALGWADENAWSPQEFAMRHTWEVAAGLPRPLCNQPVFDLTGRHVATPDLVDPVAGVYGEYDGELHLARAQRDRDLRREGLLRAQGLEGATMTAPDLANPTAFVDRLLDAYRRAQRRPHDERTWTLEQPEWWVPTGTVAQRRALTADQRRRFLALRLPRERDSP